MLKAIFNWFTGKPASEAEAPRVPETSTPYKVESPSVVAPVVAPPPAPEISTEPAKTRTAAKPRAGKKPAAAMKAPPPAPKPPAQKSRAKKV